MANQVRRSRCLPLAAAILSFGWHVVLAIFVNYVPSDQDGLGLTLWIYTWSACVIGYLGVIGVLAVCRLIFLLTALWVYD